MQDFFDFVFASVPMARNENATANTILKRSTVKFQKCPKKKGKSIYHVTNLKIIIHIELELSSKK